MNAFARIAALVLLASAVLPRLAPAFELEQGVYQAGVIDFPTALNQPTTHTIHTTLELTDIAEPVLNLYNVRYGFQHGAFQLLTDLHYTIEPVHEFDYAEVKAKLQVLALDEYRSYLALGLLGRGVQKSRERPYRIDDRPMSLFLISTFELYPFQNWGGILANFYLDNRWVTLGLKVQLYQSIQAVGEFSRLHSTERTKRNYARAGVSFEGVQNLYFQLLYANEGEHWLAQVGTGF